MPYVLPRRISYNEGAAEELLRLSEMYDARSFLVLTDEVVKGTPAFIKLVNELEKNGVRVRVFSNIPREPSIDVADEVVKFVNNDVPDLIVAVGGGSVIDVSKLVRVKILRPDVKSEDISPFISLHIENRKPILVAVPTTPGTGSDVSFAFVLKIREGDREVKYATGNYELVPYESILDVEFLRTLPTRQLVITAIDGVAHSIEGLTSINSNPLSDGLAVQSLRMFFKYLPMALSGKDRDEALNNLHLAATISGMVITNSGLGLAHAIAHPLGSIFNIPHGLAVAIVLPYVVEFNYEDKAAKEKYDMLKDILEKVDKFEERRDLKEHLLDLYSKVGQTTHLRDIGISEEAYRSRIDDIVELALKDADLPFNPRPASYEDIKNILNKIY
jgi:alcohol dehydrogenase class IV